MLKCSKAQRLKGSKAQRLKGSKAQRLKGSKAQMLKCSKAQRHKGTIDPFARIGVAYTQIRNVDDKKGFRLAP